MLGLVDFTLRASDEPERIAMAVREDVTANAVELGIVVRNRAVEIDPQNLALVVGSVTRGDLAHRRKVLRVVGVTAVPTEIAALVADGEIQLQVATDDEPPTDVIVMRRQSHDDVHRM